MSKTFEEFKYWFIYKDSNHYFIIKKENQILGEISNCGIVVFYDANHNIFDDTDISEEFDAYKTRHEYLVGQPISVNGESFESVKCAYKNLFIGALMCRAVKNGQNPENHFDYINKVMDWIESTDFYDAPASTIYHESFPHGLLYHTLTVYNKMVELYQIPTFQNKIDMDSATICCLMHDWCKIGLYEKYKKNVKNDKTGQWERIDAYRRGSFPHVFGHGTTSMYMAMKFVKLTEEEALGIRWHMGHWNVSENEVNEFQQANEQYPMVHLIQFADQLAITDY